MSDKLIPTSMFYKSISDKLVIDKKEDNEKNNKSLNIDEFNLNEISNSNITSILNNNSAIELFPDIELAMDIVISSIISPKDLISSSLYYKLESNIIELTSTQAILTKIKEHVENVYELESKLETIVREALYTKGAYIEAIIPEASLSALSNIATVALEDNVNLLSKKNAFISKYKKENTGTFKDPINKIEDLISCDEYIDFTDNISILKAQDIYKNEKKKSAFNKVVGIEDNDITDIDAMFKKLEYRKDMTIVSIKSEHENITRSKSIPYIMKLPVESVIPVHSIGNPSDHLGYFVLLNQNGTPINSTKEWLEGSDNKIFDIYKTTVLDKLNKELNKRLNTTPVLKNLDEIYENIIEKRIKYIINNTDELKNIAEVKEVNNVYKLMLYRILKKEKTRLLYLPADVVQFYTFEYRDNGTGKSVLEKIALMASIRAILLFGKLMAYIKNSIPTTKITAKLDDKDPDPARTKERIIAETLKNKQVELPIGVLNVHDLVQWAHKVGYLYEFEHPNLPDIKIDLEDMSRSINVPDESLEEDITKRILTTIGVTPEMVESGMSPDFAATIITNNALMAKRIQKKQFVLKNNLTQHLRTILRVDGKLREEIKIIIANDIGSIKSKLAKANDIDENEINDDSVLNYLINNLIENISIELPSISNTSENVIAEAFSAYKDNLEGAIESFFSSDAIGSELANELGNNIDEYKNAIFHTLLRRWMQENNYMSELIEAITIGNDNKFEFDAMNSFEDYVEKILLALKPMLKDNKKLKKKIDKIYEKYNSEEDDTEVENAASNNYNDITEETNTDNTDNEEIDTGDTNNENIDNEEF